MKTKIEPRQQVVLLFTVALSQQAIRSFAAGQPAVSAQMVWLSALPSLLLLMLVYLPVSRGLSEDVSSRLCNGLFAVALALSLCMELMRTERFYGDTMETELPLVWFLAAVIAAVWYGVRAGIGGLARTATAFLWVTGLAMILLVASVGGQMQVNNLQMEEAPLQALPGAVWQQCVLLPEYFLTAMLCKGPAKQSRKNFAALAALLLCTQGALAILGECILGAGYGQENQPVYTIARLGGISVFRRLDALHVGIWMLLVLLKLMVYVWGMLQALGVAFRGKQLPCILAFAATALLLFSLWNLPGQAIAAVQQGLLWVVVAACCFARRRKT